MAGNDLRTAGGVRSAGARKACAADASPAATASIAEAIGRRVGVETASIGADDVSSHFGFLAGMIGLDIPASSEKTQRLLGWTPEGPGLLADLDGGHYFAG